MPVNIEVAKKMDGIVQDYVGKSMIGFEQSYVLAESIGQLKQILNEDYMRPIMELQGTKLGFRTDKDIDPQTKQKGNGYPMEIVKDCLIEATFKGLQPVGNMFNIIGGNMYPTKEGFEYLCKNRQGLTYDITYSNIKIEPADKSARIDVSIDFALNGEKRPTKLLDLYIKANAYTTPDAIIGKATRKALCWLYNHVTGDNLADSDLDDHQVITVTKSEVIRETPEQKKKRDTDDKMEKFLLDETKDLKEIQPRHIEYIKADHKLNALYEARLAKNAGATDGDGKLFS